MAPRSIDHRLSWSLLNALRIGAVPEVGTEQIAVGVEEPLRAIEDALDDVYSGGSGFRFVSGVRGSGKSFFASLVSSRARRRGFKKVVLNPAHPQNLKERLSEIQSGSRILGVVENLDGGTAEEHALDSLFELLHRCREGTLGGVFVLLTATPPFFDAAHPLAELGRQNQPIQLRALTREKLETVARKVRKLYPSPTPLEQVVDDEVIVSLEDLVTANLEEGSGSFSRFFLRVWVDLLDRADQQPEFSPLDFMKNRRPFPTGVEKERLLWGRNPSTS